MKIAIATNVANAVNIASLTNMANAMKIIKTLKMANATKIVDTIEIEKPIKCCTGKSNRTRQNTLLATTERRQEIDSVKSNKTHCVQTNTTKPIEGIGTNTIACDQ